MTIATMEQKETDMVNKFQRRTGKALYKEHCYILFSAVQKKDDDISWYRVKPTMSFLYDAGDVAAEWEPEYGPIQVWEKCDETYDGQFKAREHYYYDYVIDNSFNWSQLAVENDKLPQEFVRGNFDYIFSVLERWAKR